MHIVFLTNEFPYDGLEHGGIGTFVENLSGNLVMKGFKVSVIGISKKATFKASTDKGVTLYGIKQSSAKFGKFIFNSFRIKKRIKEIHKKSPIDIVEGSELSFSFIPKKTPFKKVIRMHGGHHFFAVTLNKKPAFWRSFQERKSFHKADGLIAVSDFVGVKTKELLKFDMAYTTIYNFINLDIFQPKKNVEIFPYSIFFVGTICKKKGVKELIEAFVLLKSKFKGASLHLIGRDWIDEDVGSYMAYVRTIIPKEMNDSITFSGTVAYEEIPLLLSGAQVCAYPSHMESFGLTLIEAMALEKPIVAADIGPFKEIMENEASGLLCNPNDPKEIANKISKLFDNKEKAQKLAKNARNTVLNKFDIDSILKENIQFYKSII